MIIRIATIAAILAIVLGAMQVGSVAFASGGAGGSCNNFRVDPNSSETCPSGKRVNRQESEGQRRRVGPGGRAPPLYCGALSLVSAASAMRARASA